MPVTVIKGVISMEYGEIQSTSIVKLAMFVVAVKFVTLSNLPIRVSALHQFYKSYNHFSSGQFRIPADCYWLAKNAIANLLELRTRQRSCID